MDRLCGELNDNPSPGNQAGRLTTILEKSLGVVAKGGTSTLREVFRYAERVETEGFVYMDAPAYDPVAAPGQVAGGANILAFTRGRGSAYGCKPTPSIKFATNSDLFRWMADRRDDVASGLCLDPANRRLRDTDGPPPTLRQRG